MRAPSFLVRFLNRAADKVEAAREPDFIVAPTGEPYMLRWYVIPRNRYLNVYLHSFLRSDDDRALHDHPWASLSICLENQYTEYIAGAEGKIERIETRRTGDVVFRSAARAHRVHLHAGPARTLFVTGPKVRTWGFHCPKGWRPWQEFCEPGEKGRIGRGCD